MAATSVSRLAPWQSVRLIAGLAFRDLRHEWVLTLTLVLAIAAVLAPLLLLLGLKHGTIEYNVRALVEDPVNREVVPEQAVVIDPRKIDAWRLREDIAFVVPNILPGVSSVAAERATGGMERLDVLPSGPGDPLMLDNGVQPPTPGEVVVSLAAAQTLGVEISDAVRLVITRERDGRNEREVVELTLAGVLPARAQGLERLYIDFALLEDIETYRRGEAVAERGWPGGYGRPTPSYDGLLLSLGPDVPSRALLRTTSGTGFARREDITTATARERLGMPVGDGRRYVELRAVGGTVGPVNLRTVISRLRAFDVLAFPFVERLPVAVGERAPVPLKGVDLRADRVERAGFHAPPWEELDDAAEDRALAQALVPASWGHQLGDVVDLRMAFDSYELTFPAEVAGEAGGDFVVVPSLLAGMFRSGFEQRLAYDDEAAVLRRTKDGYRGFRLYARSIDDVAGLRAHFENDEGIEVRTRAGAIERVKRMEAALTRLFWLVAVVGIVGGIAAMAASLWAAVERKRRDIGLIRLFGITKQALFGFPTCQAVMIAVGASIVAVLAFQTLATTINTVFAADLPLGEKLCTLPALHLIYAALLTVGTAFASSLLAAHRATQIEPAEAIREE